MFLSLLVRLVSSPVLHFVDYTTQLSAPHGRLDLLVFPLVVLLVGVVSLGLPQEVASPVCLQ